MCCANVYLKVTFRVCYRSSEIVWSKFDFKRPEESIDLPCHGFTLLVFFPFCTMSFSRKYRITYYIELITFRWLSNLFFTCYLLARIQLQVEFISRNTLRRSLGYNQLQLFALRFHYTLQYPLWSQLSCIFISIQLDN